MDWKIIENTDGAYECSSEGDIRNTKTGKLLGGCLSNDGYRIITIKYLGKSKPFLHHRLVAMTWHDNTLGYPQVDHIDGDRLNNHPSNLQWILSRDNVDKAKKVTYRETVTLVSPDGEEVEVDCAYTMAKDYGLGRDGIKRVMDGKAGHHKGWRRKVESNSIFDNLPKFFIPKDRPEEI